jgi:hypothetical protein
MNKPFDDDFIFSTMPEQQMPSTEKPRLTDDIQRMMDSMGNMIDIPRKSLLSELHVGDDQSGEA